jgi:hypothetical protein
MNSYSFSCERAGARRRLTRLGPMVRAHLEHHGAITLEVEHPQDGWVGQVRITRVESDVAPQTYAVTFHARVTTSPGEGVIAEPFTDEKIALAIGHAIGSLRR